MGMIFLISLMVSFGAFFLYVTAVSVAVKAMLKPLEIPDRSIFDREFFLIVFGVIAFVIVMLKKALGRDRSKPSGPRFSLAELLVMIFSLAAYPTIVSSYSGNENMAWAFIGGASYFPGLFLCALERLNTHDAPSSKARIAFLALFPYAVMGVTYLLWILIAIPPIGLLIIAGLCLMRVLAKKVRADALKAAAVSRQVIPVDVEV